MNLHRALDREWAQLQRGWAYILTPDELAIRRHLFFAGGVAAASEIARACDGQLSALYEATKDMDPNPAPEPEPFSMTDDEDDNGGEPSIQ